MALLIEPHSEIIPGYHLLERLGGGGFGEVWKAQAPGGLMKAIKIVYGDLGAGAAGGHRAEQELHALRRVQAVRHPYLLSIERYDIVEDRLLIVTELADCNLWDRFQECRSRRLAGIPRDDLLRYLQEAAEVLDLMNNQYQLQHLDIKPQNLFLVHDHVKVADFGLVQDLDKMKRGDAPETAGGATPVYAAPETFEGNLSPFCDQYSLAVVYQELLTGKRPFQAANLQQLIAQHLQAAPDMAALPAGDRAAVGRALAKRPEDRHRSCMAFVRTLVTGGAAAPAAVPAPAGSAMAQLAHLLSAPDPTVPAAPETPATEVVFRSEDDTPAGEAVAPRPVRPELTGDGVLYPAMVIAVGAVGLDVLQRVKQTIVERFGAMSKLPTLKLLYIDTDPESVQAASSPNATCPLDADEVFAARLNRPGHYLKPRRNGRSLIEGWFDSQLLYRIKPGNPLTQGMRPLGRLAFCDHYRLLEQKLRADLEAVTRPDAMDHAEAHTRLALRTSRPRVYVVAGTGGGTGSGMFIDVAYAVRHRLRQLGYEDPEVVGLLLLPPAAGPNSKPLAAANTYAALTELNHFSMPGMVYTACIDDKEMTLLDQAAPFSRFTLLPLRTANPQKSEPVGVSRAAEFLWRDLTTPFGRAADEGRAFVRSMPGVTPEPATVAGQTFGMKAISWPKRALLERTARQLCHQILEVWVSPDGRAVQQPVQTWVAEQWQAQQLDPDAMAAAFQKVCEQALKQDPEAFFAAVAEPFQPRSRWSRGNYDPAAAFQALHQLVQLVGAPGDTAVGRDSGTLELTLKAVGEAALKEYAAKLNRLAICLLDQPDYRLAGAEEAILCLKDLLDGAARRFDPVCREAEQAATEAYGRVQTILAEDTRRRNGMELADALQTFGRTRYRFLAARALNNLYGLWRDQLADPLKELSFCRQRLTDLLTRVAPGPAPETPSGTLLPEGCQTIDEAVQRYLGMIDREALRDLDRQAQAMIERQFTALAHVCLTSSDLMLSLEAAMLQLARRFMQQRLGEADVAEMFLSRAFDADVARKQLARVFAKADPELETPEAPPDAVEILAVPSGPSTERFLQEVHFSLPTADPTLTASPDDIVFYRERVTVPLKCLAHLGRPGRLAFEQMSSQQFPTHTRIDIRQWYRPDMI